MFKLRKNRGVSLRLFYSSSTSSPFSSRPRSGSFSVPVLAFLVLFLPLLVTCGKDKPTQSRPVLPARVTVTPESADLASAGQSVRLSGRALDGADREVSEAQITWRSSDASVARVSADGLVTAVGEGSAVITAMADQKTGSSRVTVSDPVRRALITLYNATGGANWTNKTNWLSESPLGQWHGVTTGEDGRVTELRLDNNNLEGPIPAELGKLAGLEQLSLFMNKLNGSIPPELGELSSLETLWLAGNNLQGTIPDELGKLTNLWQMSFAGNPGLSGTLPLTFINLTSLETLYFSGTNICVPSNPGIQAWLSKIDDLETSSCVDPEKKALTALYHATDGPNWTNNDNWLSSASLGDWHGITVDADGRVSKIVLHGNNLAGSLPGQLSDLEGLSVLDLSFNTDLSGSIPVAFTDLGMEELNLEGTGLCIAPFPEFQDWLNEIPKRSVAVCTELRRDFYVLAELYNSTGGPDWGNSTKWLSEAPLGEWHGVEINSAGELVSLRLGENNLQGPLPPELGQLQKLENLQLQGNNLQGPLPPEFGRLQKLESLELQGNLLTGPLPPELGQLRNLRTLDLTDNRFFGTIPPELGQLQNVELLALQGNQLTGPLPPELAHLQKLERLFLSWNQLSGPIPPELGQLQNLFFLALVANDLTGPIPSELGKLQNLAILDAPGNRLTGTIPPELGQLNKLLALSLSNNDLTGSIPTELGQLQNLQRLSLSGNNLTGSIPTELAQLQNLEMLRLDSNNLTGPLPPELGQLGNLSQLQLTNNDFTGPLPPELGQLGMLEELQLSFNQLTGNIPSAFGGLANLKTLSLSGNTGMAGTLPLELVGLNLENLMLGDTQLCAPGDTVYQEWLRTISNSRIARCESANGRSVAYLTQATQSLEYPVPLVAGEDALLRVFVISESDIDMPPVRATFYDDGAEAYTVDIPGSGIAVPGEIYEGDLSMSANARVPGSFVTPGLEMVIEIDPEGTLAPSLLDTRRLPPTGRTAVDVRTMPPFELTLVPFLWTENPDRSVVTEVNSLSAESDLFRYTRDLLPVGEFVLNVHEPVWISSNPVSENRFELFRLTEAIRTMDAQPGHYMGILIDDSGGVAETPGYVLVSSLSRNVIAHELGHNLSLKHPPCLGSAFGGDKDPDYPYEDGATGAWGYDLLEDRLIGPGSQDLMGGCMGGTSTMVWISDYNFSKAMRYRLSQEALPMAALAPSSRGLLLWGGVNGSGELVLEPAFAVDAPPAPPRMGGPYRLVGEDRDGGVMFSFTFGMTEHGHHGGGAFAFVLPARMDWPDRLSSITLSGPEGLAALDGVNGLNEVDGPSAALLLDADTRQVRGILKEWTASGASAQAFRRMSPEPGLEVITSRGIPKPTEWIR